MRVKRAGLALALACIIYAATGSITSLAGAIPVHVGENNQSYAVGVFEKMARAYPEAVEGATDATLVKCYDATKLNRNYGDPAMVAGSLAEKALVGNGGMIMMYGPYDRLEAGEYVVIYRMEQLDKVEGAKLCFLDVCSGGVTVSGKRPSATEFNSGEWSTIPVSVKLTEPKTVEYRFWPDGHRAAIDQVYVFKLKMKDGFAPVAPVAPVRTRTRVTPTKPATPTVVRPAPPTSTNSTVKTNTATPTPTGGNAGSSVATSPSGAYVITVPSGHPTAAPVTGSSTVVDPSAIERPQYESSAKSLLKSITSVTAMTVITTNEGDEYGQTSDIIATIDPDSRRSEQSGVGFYRPDGDDAMKTAFQEAVRAVRMRYPIWEPGHIDISFGEKFDTHAGPSAGAAFGLLMLSSLEGFEIDPKCAVTGDITVDWRVRNVGGITAKVRGAALDKCLYAAIPSGNQEALSDMVLLYGESSLWDVQVFGLDTLQDAVAVARRDRSPQMVEAMKTFAELQAAASKGTINVHTADAQAEATRMCSSWCRTIFRRNTFRIL